MKTTHDEIPNNPFRYVKAEHHYFGSNQNEWKCHKDLSYLIEYFKDLEYDYQIWYVPLSISASYRIDKAVPRVEDAHMIGAFYENMPPNQF